MFKLIGFIAFAAGMILAIAAGFFNWQNTAIQLLLLVLGIIIGLFAVGPREAVLFMAATIAIIVVVGIFAPVTILQMDSMLDRLLGMIAGLLGSAAIVVALKAAWWACSPGSARRFDPQPEPPGIVHVGR
jgi:phosphoglycerol transferase MdoB-like AlkP superfamily enzyme